MMSSLDVILVTAPGFRGGLSIKKPPKIGGFVYIIVYNFVNWLIINRTCGE